MDAEAEIAALRFEEAQMESASSDADVLVRGLINSYACDFVLANVPDGMWFPLPRGWQAGLAEAIKPHYGKPPRALRGAVAVSLKTLREIAKYD